MTTFPFYGSGHDEALFGELRVLERTEIEPLAAGGNRGGQLLQEAGKPHGEQMGAGPGDGQSPGAMRPGAARSPAVQAPPQKVYVIETPSAAEARVAAENTNTPPKGQRAITRCWHHGGVLYV